MSFLRKLGLVSGGKAQPRGKAGARAYAVGDIHGRLDLLNALLAEIEADMADREPRKTFLIFLGDLIDRGPDSAGVVERLRTYRHADVRTVFLGGNHEEVLLNILKGKKGVLPSWLKFGGSECAASYGIDAEKLAMMEEGAALDLVRARVPREHAKFVDGFADTFRFGDYLFVHAGVRPGVALDDQKREDLRWIRDPFLSDAKEHGFVVVHGHTICPQVEERPNRIGIDTGAYKTGVLTAVGIEDDRRWFLTGTEADQRNEPVRQPRAA
jgi:serine/threonine protein phosphatase 1